MRHERNLPNFPPHISEALNLELDRTPNGCGGCIHSEWNIIDTSQKPRDLKYRFKMVVCRAGLALGPSSGGGFEVAAYCTSFCGLEQSGSKTQLPIRPAVTSFDSFPGFNPQLKGLDRTSLHKPNAKQNGG